MTLWGDVKAGVCLKQMSGSFFSSLLVPPSVIWMPSTSRAAFITPLLYLGSGSIGIHRHATLLRLYLKTCTWLRMENKLVTHWRGVGNPAGSLQTHLDGQKAFSPQTKSLYFLENMGKQLIFHLHNPFVITRLIFTSGLS